MCCFFYSHTFLEILFYTIKNNKSILASLLFEKKNKIIKKTAISGILKKLLYTIYLKGKLSEKRFEH